MKSLFIILLISLSYSVSFAQNCQQYLSDATRAYYNGQLREVESSLEGCLKDLEKEDRFDALKLLVNTSLLLNEDEKADGFMKELLALNPQYTLRKDDLVEFRNLFNEYEIISKYTFGINGGIMRPDYRIVKHQSYSGDVDEPEDYNESMGYIIGFTGNIRLYNNFYFSTSVLFDQRGYEQQETILNLQVVKSTLREYRLNIPLQIKYIYPAWKIKPFVSGGYSYHYLLRSEGDLEHFSLKPEFTGIPIGVPYSKDGYDLTNLMRRSTFNWVVNTGIQIPTQGRFLLELKFTYERGLHNLIEEENRFSDPILLEDFAYVPDDVKMSSWMFSLSFTRNYTKPIKK
jgi:hypothetical protein